MQLQHPWWHLGKQLQGKLQEISEYAWNTHPFIPSFTASGINSRRQIMKFLSSTCSNWDKWLIAVETVVAFIWCNSYMSRKVAGYLFRCHFYAVGGKKWDVSIVLSSSILSRELFMGESLLILAHVLLSPPSVRLWLCLLCRSPQTQTTRRALWCHAQKRPT